MEVGSEVAKVTTSVAETAVVTPAEVITPPLAASEDQSVIDSLAAKVSKLQTPIPATEPVTPASTTVVPALAEAQQQVPDQVVDEAAKKAESQEGITLTPEQRKAFGEEFLMAFREHPGDMVNATKKAAELARAKAEEIRLQQDQNATDEQIDNASKTSFILQNQYNSMLERMIVTLPKDTNGELIDSKLIAALRSVPGDPEILGLLQNEAQEGAVFTPEERKVFGEVFQKAFRAHLTEMFDATKQAAELARAKAEEIRLQQDQNATEEQKNKASEILGEKRNRYSSMLGNMMTKLPIDDKIFVALYAAPDNLDMLKLLQDETKKGLINLLIESIGILAIPIADEARKAVMLPLEQPR